VAATPTTCTEAHSSHDHTGLSSSNSSSSSISAMPGSLPAWWPEPWDHNLAALQF
jgi:hypothetical protein